jgi:2-polyprenyl-3-methyl-5-hydroxy-6-metoxy-1,4-benzoquinol methylase
MSGRSEGEVWRGVTDMLGDERKELGSHWSFNLLNDPKRLGFVLSRYKLAAKLATRGRSVLELGCSEGIGAPLLAEQATGYVGVDLDEPAIEAAQRNFARDGVSFQAMDFLGQKIGRFDSVVSLDVIEHIHVEYEDLFLSTVTTNLAEGGICLVGTPNITSEAYASAMSRAGHVNLYDADRLAGLLGRAFHVVFSFGMNDEIVHTGFSPMAHYIVAMGVYRR